MLDADARLSLDGVPRFVQVVKTLGDLAHVRQ